MIAGGVDVEQCLIYILGSGKPDFSNVNPAQGGRNFVPMEGMEYKENTAGEVLPGSRDSSTIGMQEEDQFDVERMSLLCTSIEKQTQMRFCQCHVFCNARMMSFTSLTTCGSQTRPSMMQTG